MANCLTCGKQFHACGNCDLSGWEWDFCNVSCLEIQQRKVIAALTQGFNLEEEHLRAIIDAADRNYLADRWPKALGD